MFCQERFREEQMKQAQARYEARPEIKKIREHQKAARKAADRVKTRFLKPLKPMKHAIAKPAAAIDKLGRYHSEPLQRPKGARGRIKLEAARKYGVDINDADRCWRLARRMLARMRAESVL